MFKKIKRLLFPTKYLIKKNAEHLSRIEKNLAEQRKTLDLLALGFLTKSPLQQDAAQFFYRKSEATKSQCYQDLWVMWETKEKTNGFFVEFGASDGQRISNTLLLETNYGWNGILAEPVPICLPLLRQRRAQIDSRCVWKHSNEKITFLLTQDSQFSTLQETSDRDRHAKNRLAAVTLEVETVSLLDLLTEHQAPKVIDYLSLDTEGSEYEILSHFDFSRFQINLITVEHNYNENRTKIYDLLSRHGFNRVFKEISGFDDWYVHKNLRALT